MRSIAQALPGQVFGIPTSVTFDTHFRHSLISALANVDVSEEVRRKIVGHESPEVHAIYTHYEQETLARAIGKLPSV